MVSGNIVFGQKVDRIKLQRARELRRGMTEEESILWSQLRTHRLHGLHFRRQQVIDGFIVDFYCHSRRLVVEVDGGIHQEQAAHDSERDQILRARELRILRVRNEDVRNDLASVLASILLAAEHPPTPPST